MRYRQVSILTLAIYILLAVCSCSSCSNGKRKAGEENPRVRELDETKDEAELVRLEKFTQDSLFVFSMTKNRNEAFGYADAKANGHIHGSLKVGDQYSLFPEGKTKTVCIAINVTEMNGRWIFDQQQRKGFDFNPQGAMSSINSNDICFRQWKLLNGRLYIYYVDIQQVADDRHQFEVEEANIMQLSDKELVFIFKGDTYYCKRPSTVLVTN